MVVALTFDCGRVHLRSRFVATKERLEEEQRQKFLYRGQMGTQPNSPVKDTAILVKNLVAQAGISKPLQHQCVFLGWKGIKETVCCLIEGEREGYLARG